MLHHDVARVVQECGFVGDCRARKQGGVEVGKIVGVVCGFILLAMVIAFIAAFPFMWIWNYAVVGAISVANPIGYWQAFWLAAFLSMFKPNNSSSKS